ncbi:hypothetical protein PQE68_gp070 [Bacillus phage vB_BanS_Sophrita]|uniref:Uncharacterized protein n=1 Tax=Bacillus phage vB_BanS_Sophrita TaxID=2894790 RepID=A0AAE8YTS9_9CAUD|nr:hypothetical protein PQE68_gp070 [Bacillus phage vB_BanS_Sophrita]UGO50661.1 hypothetical protein SOPHRITA_70 [Bacillus phage vB_BanS_Sophrita]
MFERKYTMMVSKFDIFLMYVAGFTLGGIIGTAITHIGIKLLGL